MSTGLEPVDWQARLAEQMAEHERRRQARADERADRADRRRAGLEARHRRKLARVTRERH